jgi:hypothetical protein
MDLLFDFGDNRESDVKLECSSRGLREPGGGTGPHLDSVRWLPIVINVGARMPR